MNAAAFLVGAVFGVVLAAFAAEVWRAERRHQARRRRWSNGHRRDRLVH